MRTRAEKKRNNKRFAIGRVYAASPKYVEIFTLKHLLVSLLGRKSFPDLQTVYGAVYEAFKGASYN